MLDIVHAVQKTHEDGREYIQKYEIPEFKIEIPMTPQPEKKKLQVPRTTGGVRDTLPTMYQVPAIFDILVSPKNDKRKYSSRFSEQDAGRISEILYPPMNNDEISAVTMKTFRKSRSKSRSKSKKRSSSKNKKSGKRSSSLPSILPLDEEEDQEERDLSKKKKKSSPSRSKTHRMSSSDPITGTDKKSFKRSSSKSNLKKQQSEDAVDPPKIWRNRRSVKDPVPMQEADKRRTSKALKKQNSCPSLVEGASEKKKIKVPKKSGSLPTQLATQGGKKKKGRRTLGPRSNSNSTLDPHAEEEESFAETLKAQVEAEVVNRLREVQQKLENEKQEASTPSPPPMFLTPPAPSSRKSGDEEERIRVFAEAQRRAASLSPSRYSLGDLDCKRIVESNDRRFRKSWSKVAPTPPKAEEPKRWSGPDLPPSISLL